MSRWSAFAGGSWPRAGQRLWAAGLISAALHGLLSPLPWLLGLAGLALRRDPLEEPAVDEIPIELLSEEPGEPAPPPERAAPVPAAPVEAGPKAPSAPKPAPPTPAASPPAPPPKPRPDPAAQARDPVLAAGDAGKVVDSNANVRALLYNDRIREHELGPRIGELLRRTPQWGEFFGPSGVDPVADIDRVLVAGPSLRSTANMIAVVEHHLPAPVVEGAFEGLVVQGGEWLSKEPLLAKAKADGAERLFASPGGRIVAVAPPSAEKSLRRLKKTLTFPEGPPGVVAQLYVKDLLQLAKMFRVPLAETLGAGRALVIPEPNGGAVIRVELEDTDKKATPEHAETLELLVLRSTELDLRKFGAFGALAAFALGGSKTKFVDDVEFRGHAGKIEGEIRLTRKQLLTLIDLIDSLLPPERTYPRKRPKSPPEADGVGGTASTLGERVLPPSSPREGTASGRTERGAAPEVAPEPPASPPQSEAAPASPPEAPPAPAAPEPVPAPAPGTSPSD